MRTLAEGDLLWQPDEAEIANANLTHYQAWLEERHGLRFDDYRSLWRWSIENVNQFWMTIWDYFDIQATACSDVALADAAMPGATWFPGARLNYAENLFAKRTDAQPMLIYQAEDAPLQEYSWQEIYEQVQRVAQTLTAMGVGMGDRVVAYLPNCPEAVISLLAVASIGAVWSSCAPDFGTRSVLDRFSQIEPKVLIAVDGYRYGGRLFDRRAVVDELQNSLPSLTGTILVTHLSGGDGASARTTLWKDVQSLPLERTHIDFAQVPFDHPLWVLYSSRRDLVGTSESNYLSQRYQAR